MQSKRMRNMRVLFDGPVPTALDATLAAKPAARNSPGLHPSRASPSSHARATQHSSRRQKEAVNEAASVGMWREAPPLRQYPSGSQENVHPHPHSKLWRGEQAMLQAISEDSQAAGSQFGVAGRLGHGLPQAPPGVGGRKFAGVQSLTNMFETTRLSQVAPHRVSKVKSLVREIEGVRPSWRQV